MKTILTTLSAVTLSALLITGCEQKTTEIDYQKLAQAIGEEIKKANSSAEKSPNANAAPIDYSKPVTKDEIDYIIEDRGYDFSRPFGNRNYPACFVAFRRGGAFSLAYDFDNASSNFTFNSIRNCTQAVVSWAKEKNVKLPPEVLKFL